VSTPNITTRDDDEIIAPSLDNAIKALPLKQRHRIRVLEDSAATFADKAAPLHDTEERIRASVDDAHAALGWAQERTRDARASHRPPDEIKATEADEADKKAKHQRELDRLNGFHDQAEPIRQRAFAARDLVARMRRHVAGLGVSGAKRVEQIEPKLPASGRDVVAAQRALRGQKLAEIEAVETAPLPAEAVKSRLRHEVAELGQRGEPGVLIGAVETRIDDRTGKPITRQRREASINWPVASVGAEPSLGGSGDRPRAIDAAALVCWAMPEKVISALEADVDAEYADIDLALEPHEKARRLRELRAEILAIERIECEAIWQAIEAGETDVFFRADADPRAVLGIA
jgi:hypothetical protein